MQSSDRNCFISSHSRADRALHMLRTVSSTDTCQLTVRRRDRWDLVRGTQEPTGALFADEIAGRAVDENRAVADAQMAGVVRYSRPVRRSAGARPARRS